MLLPKPSRIFCHTINRKIDHVPYVLHILQKDENYRTTILSFSEKKDATFIANMIEQYKIEKGTLPENTFSYDCPFELELHSENKFKKGNPLDDFYIEKTSEENIYEYCAKNLFDLMIIGDFDNNGRIKVYSFNISLDHVRQRFEKVFYENL